MRRILLVLLCLGLLTACGSTTQPQATGGTATTPDTITIKNFAFTPMDLTVTPGTKITVRNDDTATHTLTASNKSFDTGDIAPGATATITAPTKPGEYAYLCDIHQFMQGTLTVK